MSGKAFTCSVARSNLLKSGRTRCPVGDSIFSHQAWGQIARSLKLSEREIQIVRGVFNDRTETSMAIDLGLSPHTIHTYCERLHHKLGITDRVRLVLRVMDEFLALTAAPKSTLPSICANRTAGRCPLLRVREVDSRRHRVQVSA